MALEIALACQETRIWFAPRQKPHLLLPILKRPATIIMTWSVIQTKEVAAEQTSTALLEHKQDPPLQYAAHRNQARI